MTFVYITLGVLVILFIIVMIIVPSIKYKKALKVLNNFEGFKAFKKKIYDATLENSDTKIYIKLVDVPSNSMICINAKDTWELSYGGSSKDIGRSYPNKKYLDELKQYLKWDINDDSNKKIIKLIVVNKKTEKVVRYLNETELDVVTPNQTVYGYRVWNLEGIEKELEKEGIKKSIN